MILNVSLAGGFGPGQRVPGNLVRRLARSLRRRLAQGIRNADRHDRAQIVKEDRRRQRILHLLSDCKSLKIITVSILCFSFSDAQLPSLKMSAQSENTSCANSTTQPLTSRAKKSNRRLYLLKNQRPIQFCSNGSRSTLARPFLHGSISRCVYQ